MLPFLIMLVRYLSTERVNIDTVYNMQLYSATTVFVQSDTSSTHYKEYIEDTNKDVIVKHSKDIFKGD